MASRVALIQCGDHLENQRRVLWLARALAERGWRPVAMTYGAHQGAYLLRHGVDVIALGGGTGQGARGRLRRVTAAALPARMGATYRGVDTATIADIESARQPQRFATATSRYRFHLMLRRRVDALIDVLDRTRPGHVYVWNGLTGMVAHGLRMLCVRRYVPHSFIERGLLPDSVFVDRRGVNGASELCRTELESLRACSVAVPSMGPPMASADERTAARRRHGLGDARVVFVPLQVQRDTNILFHSDHIKTMQQLVACVADATRGTGAVVVVRRHPEEVDHDLSLPEAPNVRYIDEGTAEAWCDYADLVVTVNSTVGMTALMRGRPVVVLGRALYSNKGLCREPRPTELRTVLGDDATYRPPDRRQVSRFLEVLIGRHTAAPERVPLVIDEAVSQAAGAGWSPALTRNAQRVAQAWQQRVNSARQAAGSHVHVWNRLGPGDTLDMTYRRDRAPHDAGALASGIAALLEIPGDRLSLSPEPPSHATPCVVLQGQSHSQPPGHQPLLVLDQYLEPHLGWIAGHRR